MTVVDVFLMYTEHLKHKQKSIMGKYSKSEGKWNKLTG